MANGNGTSNGNGNGDTTDDAPAAKGWMSDVQRALALTLIGTFAITVIGSTLRVVLSGDVASVADMAKTLQAAMVNMSLIALGFFFGNTMAKMAQDAGQQKVVDKLTSTQPPNGGPVAPVPSTDLPAAPASTITPWWTMLGEAEKTAITAAGVTDPRVAAFVMASTTGSANADDLAYLVSKGLLTQDRANAIKAA